MVAVADPFAPGSLPDEERAAADATPPSDGSSTPASREDLGRAEGVAAGTPTAVFPNGIREGVDRRISSGAIPAFMNETQEQAPRRSGFSRVKGFLWGSKLRRSATIISILGGGGLIGGTLAFSVVSGPFEFIHIGQILDGHFTHIRLGSETRLGKLLLGKPFGIENVGDTRLGFIGRSYKNRILADLAEKGIKPQFEKGTTRFSGYEIDTSLLPDGLYQGNQTAAQDQLAELLGLDKSRIVADPDTPGVFKIAVDANGKIGLNDAAPVLDGMIRLSGTPKTVQWINARVLGKYGLVFRNWHIFRRLETSLGAKVQEGFLKALRNFQQAKAPEEVVADNAEIEQKDPNTGKPVLQDIPDAPPGAPTVPQTKSTLQNMKDFATSKTGKAIGGIAAAAVALICIIYAVAQSYHAIQYVQVMVPMMRMGIAMMSGSSQLLSGQDVNDQEINAMESSFSTIDPKTGQGTSNWSDAAAVRAAEGQTGGIDVSSDLRDSFSATPGWLAWTSHQPVPTICGPIVGIGLIAVGILLDLSVVGILINVAVAGLGFLVIPHVIDWAANFLAGKAVDVTATGAQWGNYVSYGTKLAANAEALQYGGVQLTDQQVAELDRQSQAANTAEFQSHDLAYRVFSPEDHRTIVGSAIDQLDLSSPQVAIAKITYLPGVIGSLFSLPSRLFSSLVHADPQPYKWPFPEFGFSNEDLNNPAVADPQANALAVSQVLDSQLANGDNTYANKALDCFGVNVTKGPDGWDAVPSTENSSTDQERSFGVNPYDDQKYSASDCIGNGDSMWLRVRFWIFDTRVMEGYACTLDDATSCTNSGWVGAGVQ